MNFMKYTKLWFGISLILIIPGLIALFTWKLQIGLDFKGGTLLEIQFSDPAQASQQKMSDVLDKNKDKIGGSFTVQPEEQGSYMVRTGTIDEATHQQILDSLKSEIGDNKELRFENVGPTISKDLTQKAIVAVIVASFAIILFVAWAFRGVPKPASSWRFGLTAVAALLHDLLFVVGSFAILGHFFHYEVDSLFITALLTVMGFSVHDTIVVFDRIRENLKRSPARNFTEISNISLTQTLGRSLGTSLTVIFVLSSLFLLGGGSTKPFILALLLGVTIGTYSSIFNATPLLVVWQEAISRRQQAHK